MCIVIGDVQWLCLNLYGHRNGLSKRCSLLCEDLAVDKNAKPNIKAITKFSLDKQLTSIRTLVNFEDRSTETHTGIQYILSCI